MADAQARDGLSLHVIGRFIQNGTALDGSIRQFDLPRQQEDLMCFLKSLSNAFVCYGRNGNIKSFSSQRQLGALADVSDDFFGVSGFHFAFQIDIFAGFASLEIRFFTPAVYAFGFAVAHAQNTCQAA